MAAAKTGRTAPTSPEKLLAALDLHTTPPPAPRLANRAPQRGHAQAGDAPSGRVIAEVLGVHPSTVANLLERYQPVASALREIKRDHLLGIWQWAYLQATEHLEELYRERPATLRDKNTLASAARNWSVVMAISTEKALLLSGQPTSIIAGIHEVRVQLPELLGRLARVAQAHQRSLTTQRVTPEAPAGGDSVPEVPDIPG